MLLLFIQIGKILLSGAKVTDWNIDGIVGCHSVPDRDLSVGTVSGPAIPFLTHKAGCPEDAIDLLFHVSAPESQDGHQRHHRLLYRRLGICAEGARADSGFFQLNMFIDYEALEREKRLQGALSEVRSKYGANALFTGKNMLKGATQLERNQQIGGHRA